MRCPECGCTEMTQLPNSRVHFDHESARNTAVFACCNCGLVSRQFWNPSFPFILRGNNDGNIVLRQTTRDKLFNFF